MKKYIPYLIIIALLLSYIIYFDGCNGKQDYELIDTTTTTTIKYDSSKAIIETIPDLVKEEIPQEYKYLWRNVDTAKIQSLIKIDSAYIMSLVKFDTLGIVKDWLTKRTFARDTVINQVHLKDSIWTERNRVIAFLTEVANLRPTEHNTKNELNFQAKHKRFYAGLKGQTNAERSNVFVTVGYQGVNVLYIGGIGLLKEDGENRPIEVGVLWNFDF